MKGLTCQVPLKEDGLVISYEIAAISFHRIDLAPVSRAFVKEDVDVPDRSVRRRSASGLPPGAVNYLTAAGAKSMERRIAALVAQGDAGAARDLSERLASATIVPAALERRTSVGFGATVTVRLSGDETREFRIVGVDEVDQDPRNVSWVSPTGRALLGLEIGSKVTVDGLTAKVERISEE